MEKNISSSVFQEKTNFKTQVTTQKTQNVHPQEEEMTSLRYRKHPHVIMCAKKKSSSSQKHLRSSTLCGSFVVTDLCKRLNMHSP